MNSQQAVNTIKRKSETIFTIDQLKQIALARYETYAEFGKHLGGLSRSYAHHLLNGRRVPKRNKTYMKIANALGMNPIVVKASFMAHAQQLSI